jgi:2,3-bisphosphoglycerate-independent phosphoglycerate mutase
MNMKKVGLIILDGWGIGAKDESDAVFKANTPIMDGLLRNFANGTLLTDGENVGLPEGQMGNSEVGHMNIGAGRVVFQDLVRINKDIREGELRKNRALIEAFEMAKDRNCKLHFMGLVSDGGVHSSQEHLHALCDYADAFGLEKVFIHAFTDGRDTDPKSGLAFIEKLETHIQDRTAKIASVVGRYYAMDRDKRWERVKLAYDLLVNGEGEQFESAAAGMKTSYEKDITDEFIMPFTVGPNRVVIEPNDVVVCFNFRTDRCREITQVLTQSAFQEYNMSPLDL